MKLFFNFTFYLIIVPLPNLLIDFHPCLLAHLVSWPELILLHFFFLGYQVHNWNYFSQSYFDFNLWASVVSFLISVCRPA